MREKIRTVLSVIPTDKAWPLRGVSISSSNSIRPLSGLALSFQTLAAEQCPEARTSPAPPPPPWDAAAGKR